MQQLNIVFPCFNPSKTWKNTFLFYSKELITNLLEYHIQFIIVNDGSSKGLDSTDIEIIKKELPQCTVISHEFNQGKGQALRTGVALCNEGHVIYCDIDYPFGVEPFVRLVGKLDAGNEVVVGKRDHSYHAKLPFLRRSISILYQWLNRIIIPIALSGCQAGMMGFRQEAKSLFLETRINRFLFATEFAKLVHERRLKYTCVALKLRDIEPHTTINKKSMLQEFSNLIFLITRVSIFKH